MQSAWPQFQNLWANLNRRVGQIAEGDEHCNNSNVAAYNGEKTNNEMRGQFKNR